MSNVKWKFFRITDGEHIDLISEALASRDKFFKAAIELRDRLGANEVYQYASGAVAAFCFYGTGVDLDTKVWKRVKNGHMPKVKTDLAREVENLPKIKDANDVCKFYGFGGEMVLGERASKGFRMHSSYIRGVKDTSFWCISVPYTGEFEKPIDPSLVELKEWEVLKRMDELTAEKGEGE